jgi:hypothetical protein
LADIAALGVDEIAFLPSHARGTSRYVSGLVDIFSGGLLDVVEERTSRGADRLR